MSLLQNIPKRVRRVTEKLQEAGASECMLVGGWVRDQLMGLPSTEIDIEVYGLGYDEIVDALRGDFRVSLVGKSFGVVKIGNWLDINIPRRESKFGVGHTGFTIDTDPTLTPYEATARRDFTINAIGLRPDGSLHDPFDGCGDIERKVLRATTEAFKEDPLRVLRGMQLAARLRFDMDERTVAMCREIVDEFRELSPERVWEEWKKWALLAVEPSRGLRVLRETGWIENFPEIAAMVDVPQREKWHPEGDVFTHTLHACDAAAAIAQREGLDEESRITLMTAALCHDFGKAVTTVRGERGHWNSPGHACEGVERAVAFLERMRAPNWVGEHVAPLIREHMAAIQLKEDRPTRRQVRRLAHRLRPATIQLWAALVEADASGRPPLPAAKPAEPFRVIAEEMDLETEAPKPILLGRHLIELGMSPGPAMGPILNAAFEAQLDGDFTNVDGAVAWARARLDASAQE